MDFSNRDRLNGDQFVAVVVVVGVRGVGVDGNDASDGDNDDYDVALFLRVPFGDKTWSRSIAITTESEQKQKREVKRFSESSKFESIVSKQNSRSLVKTNF